MNRFDMLLCICSAGLILSACSNGVSGGNYENQSSFGGHGDSAVVWDDNTYEFPAFLQDDSVRNPYGSISFRSFSLENAMTDADGKTIGEYSCIGSYQNGTYYSISGNNGFGLISADGRLLIPAEYESIQQVRPDTFQLETGGVETFAVVEETVVTQYTAADKPWFLQYDDIRPETFTDTETGNHRMMLTLPDDSSAGDTTWKQITEIRAEEIGENFVRAYRVSNSEEYYIIAFDRYCNYTMFDGCYASLTVTVGDETESCYVLGYTDYRAMNALLTGFTASAVTSEPEEKDSENSTDMIVIQILDSENPDVMKRTVTLTPDGKVVSAVLNSRNQTETEIRYGGKEVFPDFIRWMNTTVQTEYPDLTAVESE